MRQFFTVLSLVVVSMLAASGSACAHAVYVECKVQGDKLEVEAYYEDDTRAVHAKVQIVDGHKNVVANGTTDKNGQCSFAAPPPGEYEVLLNAGAGHRAKCSVTVPAAPPTFV